LLRRFEIIKSMDYNIEFVQFVKIKYRVTYEKKCHIQSLVRGKEFGYIRRYVKKFPGQLTNIRIPY